jgi:hypothetical protein
LLGGNTYGRFAELAAYEWLMQCVPIETQVPMAAGDVLSANGSTLDGKFKAAGVYFDAKAFGFNGFMVKRLREKLEAFFPKEQVLIDESWDLSMDEFHDLLGRARDLATELKKDRVLHIGRMQIRVAAKSPVTVSSHERNRYYLAQQNARFPFKNSHQFTRKAPFVLIFIVHPWFNGLTIHNDFAGEDTKFTRALTRRAFMQFSNDQTKLETVCGGVDASVTMADACKLLSAIFHKRVAIGCGHTRGPPALMAVRQPKGRA